MQNTGKYRDVKDQFYTCKDTANFCVEKLKSYNFEGSWIEPSAGTGVFLDLIPDAIGYDIDPKDIRIYHQDFLKLCIPENSIIFGNPPFGRQGSLAKQFIKHSAEKAQVIAFILPLSFVKPSMQNAFPLNFHLLESIELSKNSFLVNSEPYDVPCVFQIWQRKDSPRNLDNKQIPVGFEFVKHTDPHDIVFRRVGVNAGKCSKPNNQSPQSHYFIKFEQKQDIDSLIEKSQQIDFKQNTTGPKSISKSEACLILTSISNTL